MKEVEKYEYNGYLVQEAPYFRYEITISKNSKEDYQIIAQRYINSPKLLSFKSYNDITYYKGYTIEKDISLVGVPSDFIKENNLQIYQKRKKK